MTKHLWFFIGLLFIAQCSFANCCGLWHRHKLVHAPVVITVFSGTIRANVEKAAYENGWPNVIWRSPNDYRVDVASKISAANFKLAMAQLLQNYPLQAVFYKGNHVLVVEPRTIK